MNPRTGRRINPRQPGMKRTHPQPRRLVEGIVLALRYDEPKDEKAVELQTLIRSKGIEHVLTSVCGLKKGEPLHALVLRQYNATEK